MKILFQTIGVLIQYNWALPYYLSREDVKITLITNMFSYFMGGYYYHFKALNKLTPLFTGFGLPYTQQYDKNITSNIPVGRLSRGSDVIHLNDSKNPLTKRLLNVDKPKLFFLHGSLDIINLANPPKELEEIRSKVDAFVVASNHAAYTVRRVLGFTPIVIHHGIDTMIFNPFNITKQRAREKLSIPLNKRVIL
ncbi:hypothetical protein [Pyrodictium occultum]|uniref:hypothetical protein n=1 Tax=Pyrodictium occultum TaxID=2309 RepID=UPI00144330FE|nr:hypothetical protein [Pyrodictium occultum]